MKFRKSRLQKVEEKRSLRQAIFFFILTILLILAVFFLGIPLVVKLAIFLGEKRSPSQYKESTQLIPPTQPRLQPFPQATNSAILTLTGFAPAGIKVKVFLNEVLLKEITADKNGEFMFRNLNLAEGDNKIKVISFDNDKESEPYIAKIMYKKTPPALEVTSPKDNTLFFDEEKEIAVEGKTEPGVSVSVNQHLAIVDTEGNFEIKITLAEGENQIKIVAQDEAGNQAEIEKKVTYTP